MPWRRTRDPYAILVSEMMLQQTQVARVGEYYEPFLKQFPSFRALARAKRSDVLKAWQGLGYNRRALFLQRSAEIIVRQYGGRLPRDRALLESLPGIGTGTSGSLMAFAFNKPEIFIETNIRRVFTHFFFQRRKRVTDAELERCIGRSVDQKRAREWYWALMDYGAAMKGTHPRRRSAHDKRQPSFVGSDRELRGKIVRVALSAEKQRISAKELSAKLVVPRARLEKVLSALGREGFIVRKGNHIYIQE